MKIKTVDIDSKVWFDKVNGNSYFSLQVTVNYGMKNSKTFYRALTGGYNNQYIYEGFKVLQDEKVIPKQDAGINYWNYYDNNNIIARYDKKENCLKRDVIKFGIEN